jgi:selenocysteine lyase/cysteine desulfurase
MTGPDPGYFLYHSIGLFPGKEERMAEALSRFARIWSAPDDSQWPTVLAERTGFVARWEALIDAPAGSLTTSESVTAGLHAVLRALPEGRLQGKRVLVAADCFPSLHFLLSGLAGRMGFTLDTVPLRDGRTWVDEADMIARLGPDVALTLVTLVTSTASYRADLDRLLPEIRAAGSLVALDLTQGIGIVPFSAADHAPDIVVSTSLKWLCGAPGAGILHLRPDLLAECRPELRGWFSQPDPFAWDLGGFAYAPDARRFDAGTPSPLAAIASVPGLDWHAAQDAAALRAHSRRLCATILDAAPELGLTPAAPAEPERRGGSVMLRVPEGVDAAATVSALRAERLHLDARGPILRLSPGPVTTQEHVARLLDALPAALRAC